MRISPSATPSSTPIPTRRDDAFGGPSLSLFGRPMAEPLPPSQSFPGREANEAVSLMSYQSAMLDEMVADREAAAAEEGERQPNANGGGEAQQGDGAVMRGWSPRASFLWPSSLSFPRGKETRAPPQL